LNEVKEKMGRRSNQSERKNELMSAAAKIVGGKGIATATLGAIADEAGMSANAALYYYPNLKSLLEDVQQQAVERFCTARFEAIAKIAEPKSRLAHLLANGLPQSVDDELCRLLYELGSFARNDAAYAARHILLFERQVALYMSVLEAGAVLGQFKLAGSSLDIARALVVMEDGLGLHVTNKVQCLDREAALALMRSACGIATGLAAYELIPVSTAQLTH
jgi:AcrR family transcriptional regulator